MSVLFTVECDKALRGQNLSPPRNKSAGFVLRSARLCSLASLLVLTGPVQAWPGHAGANQFKQGGIVATSAQTGSQEDAQTFYVSGRSGRAGAVLAMSPGIWRRAKEWCSSRAQYLARC